MYPRNIPYAFKLGYPLLPWLLIGFGWSWVWYTSGTLLPAGGLDVTALVVLPVILGRHALVVYTWQRTGRYENAAPTTVRRHREFGLGGVVAAYALFELARAGDPAQVVAVLAVVLVPKLLFDLRDAGIGPWPFTPKTDVPYEMGTVSDVTGNPLESFATRTPSIYGHSLVGAAILAAVVGALILGGSILSGFVLGWRIPLLVLCALVVGYLLVDMVTQWLAYANLQYRVYDGTVVAYDQYLNEPQWRLDADEIAGIRIEQNTSLWPTKSPDTVVIEQLGKSDKERSIKYLDRPEEFTQAMKEHVVES